jgi:hypothetical protein
VGRKNIQTREEGFGGLGRAKIPDREQTKDLFFGAGKKNSPGWKTRVGLQSRPFPAYDGLTEQGLIVQAYLGFVRFDGIETRSGTNPHRDWVDPGHSPKPH